MKNKLVILFTVTILGLIISQGCENNNTVSENQKETKLNAIDSMKALSLINSRCFSCHNPDVEIDNRIAPPMFKIREHYLTDDSITKSQFVEAVLNFVTNPTEDKSIMPGAVANFGLMPKTMFDSEEVKIIAEYLYDVDISSSAWYNMWDNVKRKLKSDTSIKTYSEMGLENAIQTKTLLGKYLLTAIKQEGTENALGFCNTNAIKLTDSMSNILNAKIKRVSDKPRNVNNQANINELEIINNFKKQLSLNKKITPHTIENAENFIGYYPIETNKMCLQCHGKENTDINSKTTQMIKKLYPNDKAIGYSENQIRGMFVVEIRKNK